MLQLALENTQSFDWKILIPIITFILGILVSESRGFRDRKRKLNNLKTVLFWEVGMNGFILSRVKNLPNDKESRIKKAYFLESLESSVYESYIGQINSLEPNELASVLYTYQLLKSAKRTGSKFTKFVRDSVVDKEEDEIDEEMFDAYSQTILDYIESLSESTIFTVSLFIKGREDLKSKMERIFPEIKFL